jgi:hypothetical protein
MHEERMTAMEKGIPFEDLQHEDMAQALARVNGDSEMPKPGGLVQVLWIRMATLCFGLLFLFGGIAVTAGFPLVKDPEYQAVWPVGLIPVLVGLGLLIFCGMCRSYEAKLK